VQEKVIKVGFLVSYDWDLLRNSIPRIYEEADSIVLALDRNRKTWSGNFFEFDETAFRALIATIDRQNKIEIYEDDFYDQSLSAMQNEIRERQMLSERLGYGGWHIQIDADEYLINFPDFVAQLKDIDANPNPARISKPVNVMGRVVTIVKKTQEGYVYVKPDKRSLEWFTLASQVPQFKYGRRNDFFNLFSPLVLIHESGSRSKEEMYFKLKNWGHNTDFDTESYYAMWKAIDGYNYRFIKDFNPLRKGGWQELAFAPVADIERLIAYIQSGSLYTPSRLSLYFKNARNVARIKGLFDRLFRF